MTMQETRTITPNLTVSDTKAAIKFYNQAFGAQEKYCIPTPDGKAILHAELQIGNSMIYLNDPCPNSDTQSPVVLNDSPVTIHLQVDDADVWFNRAVNAGATVIMPLEDAFWGDRYGIIRDAFGLHWSIGSHVEDLSLEEVQQRATLMFAS
jgi:PhnB protein